MENVMARAEFKGSITTTGRSEALRLDKALFRAHPEFRQRAKIRAHVIGPGSLLVTLDGGEGPDHGGDFAERDPVVAAYLSFLERDMSEHPERLRPFSEADIARIDALTKNVTVSDEDVIPDDVTL
jgi:antitoxin PrlF